MELGDTVRWSFRTPSQAHRAPNLSFHNTQTLPNEISALVPLISCRVSLACCRGNPQGK